MIERTSTPLNLLDVMQELEILDVSFLGADNGEWIKITDRKTLYRAAITALVEAAESDGFQVTIHCESDAGDAVCDIRVDDAPCDQLGGGCTCDDCTAAIVEAVGIDTTVYDGTPVPDDHVFEDDCERIAPGDCPMGWDRV